MKNRFQSIAVIVLCVSGTAILMLAQDAAQPASGGDAPKSDAKKQRAKRAPKPGVSTPGVRREMAALMPIATFPVEGNPDWQVTTADAEWVTSGRKNIVARMDPKTNMVAAVITVGMRPCAGLAAGFDSVWVPNCGDKTVSRVDTKTNAVVATVPVGPAASEGGIAASPEGVWLATDAKGIVSKIDPKTNMVSAEVTVAADPAGVTYGEGYVWVTSPKSNILTGIDPKTAKVVYSVEVGPGPRFVTAGGGSAWTLNQGDGTISRVDAKTGKVVATIDLGVPGTGGELAFGAGHVWATVGEIPITEVDPATNTVVKQWFGAGGDSIRVAFASIWLSNLSMGTVTRYDVKQP
jgi:virginiamycin B lyase